MNNATTEQPLPIQPIYDATSVHDRLEAKYGSNLHVGAVVVDIVERAKKAQEKYKLEKVGLFTLNGRDALLDAYQEFCDLCIYMLQFEIEENIKFIAGEIDEPRISDGYVLHLLNEAATIREHLIEQGNFE